ncbi:MAG: hypothetical protein ABIF19_15695 [Planctomycetota bacterium]
MSNLTANLKHLYLHRSFWVIYAMLGWLVLVSAAGTLAKDSMEGGEFIGLVAIPSMMGFFTTLQQVDVLSKPFSYCLPGHRKVPRHVIFFLATVTSLLGSVLFIAYPDLHRGQQVLVFCSGFFAGVLLFWVGVMFAFNVRSSASCIGLLLLVFFGGGFIDLHIIMERIIVGHPFAVILSSVLGSLAAWRLLGDPNRARRHCGVPILPAIDAWNRKKAQRYSQARAEAVNKKLKGHPSPCVEEFFLARINRCSYGGPGRYIWGGLYTTFGMALSQWKACLLGLLMALSVVLFFSYISPGATTVFFCLAGAATAVLVRLPVYGSIPAPLGRCERFAAAIVVAAIIALLTVAAMAIVSVLSITLEPFMPLVRLQGSTYTFHPANVRHVFLPLTIVPIVFALGFCFHRGRLSAGSSTILLLAMPVLMAMPWLMAIVAITRPIFLVAILVVSWLIFVVALRYFCMRRSLVGQSRTY